MIMSDIPIGNVGVIKKGRSLLPPRCYMEDLIVLGILLYDIFIYIVIKFLTKTKCIRVIKILFN